MRSLSRCVALLAVVVSLASCTALAPPTRFVGVKTPGTAASCQAQRVCEIQVLMAIKGGQCVYDVAETYFARQINDAIRWRLVPAQGVTEQFRFPAGVLPAFLKPSNTGPAWSTVIPTEPSDAYSVQRVAKTAETVNTYGMVAEFREGATGKWKACQTLDPLVVNMP